MIIIPAPTYPIPPSDEPTFLLAFYIMPQLSSINYDAIKSMLQQHCYVDVYIDIYVF
jgi:hypothetical protein